MSCREKNEVDKLYSGWISNGKSQRSQIFLKRPVYPSTSWIKLLHLKGRPGSELRTQDKERWTQTGSSPATSTYIHPAANSQNAHVVLATRLEITVYVLFPCVMKGFYKM